MPRPALFGAVFTAISCALPAQTFIVDAANGPGATFGELPVAIATVPSGSILLVRPGTYGRVEIVGKALTILATAPGVVISDPAYSAIVVRNLAAHQSVIVRGISEQGTNVQIRCLLRDCSGPVLIDDFTSQTTGSPNDANAQAVIVERCLDVSLRNCHLRGFEALRSVNSDVAVENCDLVGYDAFIFPNFTTTGAGTGATIEGGFATFARCRVRGGNGLGGPSQFRPGSAMFIGNGAIVRLCEDPSGSYTAGLLPALAVPGIAGAGMLVRDPSAVVLGSNGGPPVGGGGLGTTVIDVIRPLPSLRTVSAPPGGVVSANVTTPIGEVVLLAVSLPGRVSFVLGLDGNSRLDPATAVVMAVGVPAAGVPVTHSIAVPNNQALLGARWAWQALAWSAAHGLRLSNPSIYAH